MSEKERPLPKPPDTPFSRKRRLEEGDKAPLMADRMAMAMAEGKLHEFLQRELPESEHARKLAEMMMGMTGMTPSEGLPGGNDPEKKAASGEHDRTQTEQQSSAVRPPEDVVNAVKSADVAGLMRLLKREHVKRSPEREEAENEKEKGKPVSQPQAAVEKEIIEQLLRIAADNDLSPDWIFFRALKRYVEEYQKTGNL